MNTACKIISRKEENTIKSIISKKGLCILSGKAGVGKTTLMRWIGQDFKQCVYFRADEMHRIDLIDSQIFVEDSSRLYIFDDVNENVEDFVKDRSICKLREDSNNKILIATRQERIDISIPVVKINPLTDDEMEELLNSYGNVSEEEKIIIKTESGGNIRLMQLFITMRNQGVSFVDTVAALNDAKNYQIFSQLRSYKKSKTKTTNEAKEILYQIEFFGPLSLTKLKSWNQLKDIDNLLEILRLNGYIYQVGDMVQCSTKKMVFDSKEQRRYIKSLESVFSNDLYDSIKDDNDTLKLIDVLKKFDSTALFVSTYYEKRLQTEVVENNEKKTLEEIKGVVYTLLSNQEDFSKSLESLNHNTDQLRREALEAIRHIREPNDVSADIKGDLDELVSIINNPTKNNINRAVSIIGTIGSIASIVSSITPIKELLFKILGN